MKHGHKKAIIYCRTATVEKEKHSKNSLTEQELICKQFAQKRSYKIVEVVSDVGSGMTLNRKGLKRLMILAKQGKIDVILSVSACRLTRNFINYFKLRKQLERYNVDIDFASLSTAHRSRQ